MKPNLATYVMPECQINVSNVDPTHVIINPTFGIYAEPSLHGQSYRIRREHLRNHTPSVLAREYCSVLCAAYGHRDGTPLASLDEIEEFWTEIKRFADLPTIKI